MSSATYVNPSLLVRVTRPGGARNRDRPVVVVVDRAPALSREVVGELRIADVHRAAHVIVDQRVRAAGKRVPLLDRRPQRARPRNRPAGSVARLGVDRVGGAIHGEPRGAGEDGGPGGPAPRPPAQGT